VYFLAVFHRTSLGVAGLQAVERFHINASQLSSFIVLQLGVYAAMQIPTGVLVDRFGPRRLLLVAAATMGCAQLLFAVVSNYPMALLARAILGLGDALTFVSVLRFAAGQFAPRRYPLIVALTGTLGGVGNVVATLPLSSVLRHVGWTPTFATAGLLSFVSGVAVYLWLPHSRRPEGPLSVAGGAGFRGGARSIGRRVRTAWALPGTRAGFWVHFTSMSSGLLFGALWGVPYMVQTQGMTRDAASTVLLGSVLVTIVAGPFLGWLTGRWRPARIPVAMATIAITLCGWIWVLTAYDAPMPRWVLVSLVLFTAVGGPVSAIGFALARDYNGPTVVGTATGVVNVGGFLAVTVESIVVGLVLDHAGSDVFGGFRHAFLAAFAINAIGLVQVFHWWLRARHYALVHSEAGRPIPVPVTRHRWDLRT
jgi:MFS family permease